jgi:hypothetical protein
MATSYDLDPEQLVSRFCGSLAPGDRAAFRVAAENAMRAIACNGEGLAYRVLREVWRGYFHPPEETNQPCGVGSRRPSKLSDGPPIGAEDPRTGARDRRRFKAVG